MTRAELERALREAVRAQHLDRTPDRLRGGAPLGEPPSIDLAVIAFPEGRPPLWANLLFSRDHPLGLTGEIGSSGERPRNVRYLADITDAEKVSIAWQPGADWSRLHFPALAGPEDGPRFVCPYPASLLKVLVAIGVGMALDEGLCRAEDVEDTARAMIVESDNDATTVLVRRLHDWGLIQRAADGHEQRNRLHERLWARGLQTLRLHRTAADGGWGNAAGAGVGQIQMTAWDTARLFWLLDPDAPEAPWPGAGPLLSAGSRDRLLGWLGEPSPNRILFRDEPGSGLRFFHKVGTTENYGSDAGIVRALPPARRHYIVALLSNLGSRYGPPDAEFDVSPRLSSLGVAVDAIMRAALEPA